jgi:hypothetical protein
MRRLLAATEQESTRVHRGEKRKGATHSDLQAREWRERVPFGSSAIVGSFLASGETQSGVAEEARTRGFAAPALAGCAFVEGW